VLPKAAAFQTLVAPIPVDADDQEAVVPKLGLSCSLAREWRSRHQSFSARSSIRRRPWHMRRRAREARMMVALAWVLAALACRAALLPAWRETEPARAAAAPIGACGAARSHARRSGLHELPRRAALTVLLTVGDVPVFEAASRVWVRVVRLQHAVFGGW
jgi:hypothetical protein